MKMRTKIFAAAMLVSLAACGSNSNAPEAEGRGDITLRSYSYTRICEDKSNDFDIANGSQYTLDARRIMMPVSIGGNDITALRAALEELGGVKIEGGKCVPQILPEGTHATNLPTSTKYMGSSSVDVTVSLASENLVVWRNEFYAYFAGAAHGMNGKRYLTYYVPENTIVTLDKVFVGGYADRVASDLRRIVADTDEYRNMVFDVNAIYVPKDFYVQDRALVFVYQPYDIGPYAAGVIELPYYPDPDMLTPFGRKVLSVPNYGY